MHEPFQIRTVDVTRYVTPLREGGSLPAIVEADDDFLYVLKFRGAGQGLRALMAELICGELAKALGFRIPEIVFMNLDEKFSKTEPDEEIQDLLTSSTGTNLGLHYLSGAITFDPIVSEISSKLASQIVWFDSLICNVDRTARNTNMLIWHKELWLIDHGAALYYHHNRGDWAVNATKQFVLIKDHVLLPEASELALVNEEFKKIITADLIHQIVNLVPHEWLAFGDENPGESRKSYIDFLVNRVNNADQFVTEAINARKTII